MTKEELFADPEQWLSDTYFSLMGSYEERWGLKKSNKPNVLDKLSKVLNRSKGQTVELYELCERKYFKLVALEEYLYRNNIFYCPGDKETLDSLLKDYIQPKGYA